jgi:Flp pilus assembly protein CpaB
LVGVVVLLLITVLAVLFVMNQAASPAPDPNAQATLDAQPPVDGGQGEGQPASGGSLPIIIAAQDLERGAAIPTEALSVIPWPTEQVPPNAITDPEQVVGTRARYTIQRGEPIFSTMVVETLQQLSPFGSDTAARIPRGFTAISLPYNLITGAANAIRSGDYVNILVSMAFVDLDRDFQTVLPNLSAGVLPSDNTSPNGDGSLPPGMIVAGVTPTPVTPTPTPAPPQLITVAVSPQEALVLDYLVNLLARYPTGVNFTYTLRSAGDTSLAETQSVTLQYMVDTYRISLPTKLTYGLDRTPLPTPPAGQPVPAP